MARQQVTVWFLELADASAFTPSAQAPRFSLTQVTAPAPEFARFLYAGVGGSYAWGDRLRWTREQWLERLADPAVELWVAWEGGAPAGYFELSRRDGTRVEIEYFGLLPHAVGQGQGGALLNAAVERALAMGGRPVSVNTCSLDHPAALDNYRARGFRLVREETREKDVVRRAEFPG